MDYIRYYIDIACNNLSIRELPYEAPDKIGVELFERYAETFAFCLMFCRQEINKEQLYRMCECMILKFKDSTESPAFMYRYRPSPEMLFHTVIGATPENGALEFLQNWSPSDVWQHYKVVFQQLADVWNSVKVNLTELADLDDKRLVMEIVTALDKLSVIPVLDFYR